MKKLLVLFIGLFVMVNGAVFAQETDDDTDGSQDGYVTGSVSTSEYSVVPTDGRQGMIQPMQVNGGIEARAELNWQYGNPIINCVWFNCWMQGKAITRVINGGVAYNICAKVNYLTRNYTNVGGTGYNCGTHSVGGEVNNQVSYQGEPRGAYWVVETAHSAASLPGVGIPPYYWAPVLNSSVNL